MKTKIIVLMGKSASGKDTVLRASGFRGLVNTTTRPMRPGEVDGEDYHFVTMEYFSDNFDKFVACRMYNSVHGSWAYGLGADEFIDNKENCIVILDLVGYNEVKRYVSDSQARDEAFEVVGVYLDVPNEIRRERAKKRLGFDEAEWNRRLACDDEDFSVYKLLDNSEVKIISSDECDTVDDFVKALYEKIS